MTPRQVVLKQMAHRLKQLLVWFAMLMPMTLLMCYSMLWLGLPEVTLSFVWTVAPMSALMGAMGTVCGYIRADMNLRVDNLERRYK